METLRHMSFGKTSGWEYCLNIQMTGGSVDGYFTEGDSIEAVCYRLRAMAYTIEEGARRREGVRDSHS
jgi:hypothetical protein